MDRQEWILFLEVSMCCLSPLLWLESKFSWASVFMLEFRRGPKALVWLHSVSWAPLAAKCSFSAMRGWILFLEVSMCCLSPLLWLESKLSWVSVFMLESGVGIKHCSRLHLVFWI